LLPIRSRLRWPLFGLLLLPALVLAACGGGNEKKASEATKVALTITDVGKKASYQLPASIKGGLVQLSVTNHGKGPRAAQLVRIEGNHSIQEVLKTVASNSPKTPDWIRGQGGLGPVAPGKTQDATLNLTAGKYIVADLGGPTSGPPGYKEFTVTSGKQGSLPSTPVTITAAEPSEDHWRWDVSGPLKAGVNNVTFDSKGKNTIHFIGLFRITGNHSNAEIVKALKNNSGPPPKFVDTSSFYNTAVLDDGLSQTTPLAITKPGKYVLFCPLSDRNGGKPHFEQGLITQVDVS
jgi:hypothetical protein